MGGVASILVVDDNPKFLADALPMYGYDVTVAEDGLEALKILAKEDSHFDLILLVHLLLNCQKLLQYRIYHIYLQYMAYDFA